MAKATVSNKVVARDGFGQFIDACKLAGARTMEDLAKEGAQLSRDRAPMGHKPDPRTPKLKDSIYHTSTATTAQWGSTARHAMAIEFGAPWHRIPGNVRFFWVREGRWWVPGRNFIRHPGNRPQPFLRPAYEIVMGNWMQIARRHYPG